MIVNGALLPILRFSKIKSRFLRKINRNRDLILEIRLSGCRFCGALPAKHVVVYDDSFVVLPAERQRRRVCPARAVRKQRPPERAERQRKAFALPVNRQDGIAAQRALIDDSHFCFIRTAWRRERPAGRASEIPREKAKGEKARQGNRNQIGKDLSTVILTQGIPAVNASFSTLPPPLKRGRKYDMIGREDLTKEVAAADGVLYV